MASDAHSRREDRSASSNLTRTPSSAASASSASRTRSQLHDADDSDEEVGDDGTARETSSQRARSAHRSTRSSPISVPSDDDDDYDPDEADGDDNGEEDVDATPRRHNNVSSTSFATRGGTTSHNTRLTDFPFMPTIRFGAPEWTEVEDNILLQCVRKCGREWSKVHKAYSKAAKGMHTRSATAIAARYTRLARAAMVEQDGAQRGGSTPKSKTRGAATASRAYHATGSSSSRQATSFFTHGGRGARRQRNGLAEAEEEEEDGFAGAETRQGRSEGTLQIKDELEDDDLLFRGGMSPSLLNDEAPSAAAAASSAPSRRRRPTTSNRNSTSDQVDYDVTHESYGLTFEALPPGYEILIFSPDRYKVRGPSKSQRQQRHDEEEPAFAFQILETSIQAVTLPPNTTPQLSLTPPSMTWVGPDGFTVTFKL